ncbi:MAG: protogloblin ApPgb [Planctomycetes bacterium]|nr:protogloblin ApPgb [Planctomycetota bacterium]
MTRPEIPGYALGSPTLQRSPVSTADLALLQQTLLFGADDVRALKQSRPILEGQVEAILDVWYGFVGGNPHLLAAFVSKKTGEPEGQYLERVRKRFGQWILDTANAQFDQNWLDWQHEIGLRHHRTKKNKTDSATAADIVPFRYVVALTVPVTTTLKPFLGKSGAAAADVERMHAAWVKAVLLQTILWSRPYVASADF